MAGESPLEFPCEIPIKVFGLNEQRFRGAVLDIVHRHFETLDDATVVERSSRADKYLSMTVTVVAESREMHALPKSQGTGPRFQIDHFVLEGLGVAAWLDDLDHWRQVRFGLLGAQTGPG